MAVSLTVKLIGNTTQFASSFNAAKKTMTSGVARMKSDWGKISPAITKVALATVGLGVASIKMASDYQKGIAEITTLMGEVAPVAVKKMSNEIKNLAMSSGQALDKLTKARYDIVSAGFSDAADSAKLLEQATRTATAGVTDVSVAADILTTAINAYGKTVDDAESVSDTLFTTVRLGKTTMTELAGSLGHAIPIAAQAGVSLEELSASIAVLTARGQNTAEAVTAIRASIVELLKPTENLQKIYKAIGVTSGEALIDQYGFAGALKKVSEKATELNIPLQDVFANIRSMQGAMPLATEAADDLDKAMIEMEKRAGATEKAYKKMAATFDFLKNQVLQSFKVIMIDIGETILPNVQKAFENLQANMPEIREKIIGVAEGFKKVIEWTIEHGDLVGTIIKTGLALKGLGIAIHTFNIGKELVLIANGYKAVALAFAATPVGAAAVVAAIGIAYMTKEHKEYMRLAKERHDEDQRLRNEHAIRVVEAQNKRVETHKNSGETIKTIEGDLFEYLKNTATTQGEAAGTGYVESFQKAILDKLIAVAPKTTAAPFAKRPQAPGMSMGGMEDPGFEVDYAAIQQKINDDIAAADLAMYEERGKYSAMFYDNQANDLKQLQTNVKMGVAGMLSDTISMYTTYFSNQVQLRQNAELEQLRNSKQYFTADAATRKKMEKDVTDSYAADRKKVFLLEQGSSLASIGMNTAIAYMKAVATFPLTGGMPWTAIIAGLGVAQAGIVLSQKPPVYATGGDFVTSGPQMIMVGDNPGGRERVSVTPMSSPNINGPNNSSVSHNYSINIYANDSKSFEDFLNGAGRQPTIEFIEKVSYRREL